MIQVKEISKSFQRGFFSRETIRAVDHVTFHIEEGKTLGLLGSSGCGKSTIAKLLLGMETPEEGQILIDGKDILHQSVSERKELGKKIQMIFQQPGESFDPEMKIEKSLLEPMEIHQLYAEKKRKQVLRELMAQLNLPEILLDRYPHQISGGEAQRLAILRALTLNPRILILDEPTSMLDVSTQAQILRILKKLQEKRKLTYLFISHDPGVVQWMCDTLAVMKDGKILEYGASQSILQNPKEKFTRELLFSWYAK